MRELLESVFRQTCPPYEVIVCDDGSTDGTVGILEEYARARGLRYQMNPRNMGFIKNFEQAISLCSSDYIALCDQDDRWHPEKLSQLAAGIGNHSLICSDAAVIDGSGNKIADSFRRYQRIEIPRRERRTHSFIFGNYVMGCTSLLNRNNFIPELHPFPDHIYHDWWIAMIASMSKGIQYVTKPLIDYRHHGNNIIGAPRKSLLRDFCAYREKFRNHLNHFDTVLMIQTSIRIVDELANRALADSWMISARRDLQELLDDFDASPTKHSKANRVIFRYLNYLCPARNPVAKLLFLIENLYR